MRRSVSIPRALHDVLGRAQTPAELALIFVAAASISVAICIAGTETLSQAPVWSAALVVLLIADIAAGCAANFTSGTDLHYATHPTSRWVFIAVHWHLVVIGALLDVALVPLLLVTLYALLSAALVNLLHGNRLQSGVGGTLMGIGIVGVVLWMPSSSPLFLSATAALFIVKVVFAFAVTHHPPGEAAIAAESGPGA